MSSGQGIESSVVAAWSLEAKEAYEQGRNGDAEVVCRSALRKDPIDPIALSLLGRIHLDQGDYFEGIRLLQQAFINDSKNYVLEYEIGLAYHRAGFKQEATHRLERLLIARPALSHVRAKLAYIYYEIGDINDAARVYRDWHHLEPDNPEVSHMMHATSGGTLPKCSASYIAAHFDKLASTFDKRLVNDLKYRGHHLIVEALLAQPDGITERRTLDAGCGTGLCGTLIRPYCLSLTGVDISEKMLAVAQSRSVYDKVVMGDVCDYMMHHPSSFDLVVSSDVLIYFGDLKQVAHATSFALIPNGLVIATFEDCSAAETMSAGYKLGPHGRYEHSASYVATSFSQVGLEILTLSKREIRVELGKSVIGLVLVARKPV